MLFLPNRDGDWTPFGLPSWKGMPSLGRLDFPIKGNITLSRKQVTIFLGWLVFCGLLDLPYGHPIEETIAKVCLMGVVGLLGIFLLERWGL